MSMESENSSRRTHSDAVTASSLEMLVDAEASRDFQLNDSGLSAREAPAGNIYSGLNLGGQTRAILGNVFYTTNNNVTNLSEQKTAEESRRGKVLKILAFNRMSYRQAAVSHAHTRTCQWIFEEEAFLRWLNPDFRDVNHGFLWIKGKPGSGKSTLMKCILTHMRRHAPERKIISFFFNARGGILERSTEGCYRSLLHQMLQQFPDLHTSIRIPQPLSRGQASPISMLQNVFYEAILSLQQESLVAIIDALDECDQKEIRSMVQFFGSLADAAQLRGVTLNTCFASRHYPSITVRFCDTLLMENSKGHTQDIFIYARDSLTVRPDSQRREILDHVMQKAEGVFLWVVLVVRTLNEQFDEGRSHSELLAAISNLPDDVDNMLANIISNGAGDQHLLPTLVWVLSERTPTSYMTKASTSYMTYAAIKLGAGETFNLQEMRSYGPSFVRRFVLHASKGLVELRLYRLQFIHESVRQHILAKGLAQLSSRFTSNAEAACHVYMAELYEACLRHFQCLLLGQHEHSTLQSSSIPTSQQWQDNCSVEGKIDGQLDSQVQELLEAAGNGFWFNLHMAYSCKAFSLDRLHSFPKSKYITITNHLDGFSSTKPTASFLHLLLSSERRSRDFKVGDFPALPALIDMVRALLDHCTTCTSAIPEVRDQDGSSPPTSCAEFLIGRDLNDHCGGRYGTPLIAAIHTESVDLVLLLLNAGADVNVGNNLWSPLSAAVDFNANPFAKAKDLSVINLLLDHGADINIRCEYRGSPLGAAASERQKETVELFLEAGADVNLEDSQGCNIALRAAVSEKDNMEIIEMLVRSGAYAKVGSMDHIKFETPYRFY